MDFSIDNFFISLGETFKAKFTRKASADNVFTKKKKLQEQMIVFYNKPSVTIFSLALRTLPNSVVRLFVPTCN